MMMKRNSLSVLCLTFLLLYIDFSDARRSGGFGRSSGSRKSSISTSKHDSTHTSKGSHDHDSSSLGGHPKQSGDSPYQPSRPRYRSGTSYSSNSNTEEHIHHNPNNSFKFPSPRFGYSFGYKRYDVVGSSYSKSKDMYPSYKYKWYMRSAQRMAAAGEILGGLVLGYWIPPAHFKFHIPHEEYYYNHYMYRKYWVRPNETVDYSRVYRHSRPSATYDEYMEACIREILPHVLEKQKSSKIMGAAISGPDTGSKAKDNNSSAENSRKASSKLHPVYQPDNNSLPPASQKAIDAEDDDTVSIVKIGYPALIEQVKVRRCLELYMIYSDKYLKSTAEGLQGSQMSLPALLAIVTSILLLLPKSNMLVLLH